MSLAGGRGGGGGVWMENNSDTLMENTLQVQEVNMGEKTNRVSLAPPLELLHPYNFHASSSQASNKRLSEKTNGMIYRHRDTFIQH